MIEDPTEIPPEFVSTLVTAELLIKDPASYRKNEAGEWEFDQVDPKWLKWGPVPVIEDHNNCEHTFSMCDECSTDWGSDYYIRFYREGKLVYQSPDYPKGVDE